MEKLYTILIKTPNDTEVTVFDYTQDVVTWKQMRWSKAQKHIAAAVAQGYMVVPGEGNQPLGEEIHIVRRDEYNRTILKGGLIR